MNNFKEISKALISNLKRYNVTSIFHLPGSVEVPLYKNLSEFDLVLMKNPTAVAYAADAYGRMKNVGVGMIAQGPGIASVIPAIIQAWKDHSPLIIITGKPAYMEGNPNAWQAFPAADMLMPIAKKFVDVCENDKPAEKIKYAFDLATTSPNGPVIINICEGLASRSQKFNSKISALPDVSKQFAARILKKLAGAKKPLILAGHGSLKDANLVGEIVNQLNIPLVTTTLARGIIDENSPLNFGLVGTIGRKNANAALCESDFILALGSILSHNAISPLLSKKDLPAIFQVAGDKMDKVVKKENFAVCNVRSVLEILKKPKKKFETWFVKKDETSNSGNHVLGDILSAVDKDSTLTVDAGTMALHASKLFTVRRPNHFLYQWGMGIMGTSLPTAIGIAKASAKKVFVVAGDGGVMASLGELTTIVEQKLPIKVAIFNNNGLEFIRNIQRQQFGEDMALSFADTDFVSIAASIGLRAYKIKHGESLSTECHAALNDNMPLLLDIEYPTTNIVLTGTQWDKK